MATAEYEPPCAGNSCPSRYGAGCGSINLCRGIAARILQAGGGDLLGAPERSCPLDVVMSLGPEQPDERLAAIRAGVGIVAFHPGGSEPNPYGA